MTCMTGRHFHCEALLAVVRVITLQLLTDMHDRGSREQQFEQLWHFEWQQRASASRREQPGPNRNPDAQPADRLYKFFLVTTTKCAYNGGDYLRG